MKLSNSLYRFLSRQDNKFFNWSILFKLVELGCFWYPLNIQFNSFQVTSLFLYL